MQNGFYYLSFPLSSYLFFFMVADVAPKKLDTYLIIVFICLM